MGALHQQPLQYFKALQAIVELEQLLPHGGGQGQHLGQARAHPGARIEQEGPGEKPLAMLGHDPLEQLPAGAEFFRQRRIRPFLKYFDVGDDQTVGPDAPFEHAEAFTALRDELQETELLHVPLRDARETSKGFMRGRRPDLGALADQAHAEGSPGAQATLGHFQVTLLEDLQRQQAAGEEHGAERKERNVLAGVRHSATAATAAAAAARPRWRTSTRASAPNARASCSARYTERWRPPVQPIATVT